MARPNGSIIGRCRSCFPILTCAIPLAGSSPTKSRLRGMCARKFPEKPAQCVCRPHGQEAETGMDEPLRVAALLCARLCHDLSGPLGALIGVIDIAREEQPASETIAFAEETVGELTQR